jgi:hypothetical protein
MHFLKNNPLPVQLLILSVLVALISWPIFVPGFFSVHDETHVVDIYQMARSFELSGFPPRWTPDFNFGMGHPYFNFYYLLPYYISALFFILGFSLSFSFKAVIFIGILLASSGSFFFARRHFNNWASLIVASVYIFSPYFAVDLYVRGALGEIMLFGIIPWCFYFVNRLITKNNLLDLVFSAIFIGLLAITHNVLNIFAFPIIFSYGVILILIQKDHKKIIKLSLAFLMGALLVSYYLLPALFEKQYISNYEQINIEDHFPFLKQLFIPHWGYSISHWGPNDDISFQIGISNLVGFSLGGVSLFFVKGKKRVLIAFFTAVFLICFLLMNYRTLAFWNLSPILRYIQFPWRMLLFTSFTSAILAGFAVEFLSEKIKSKKPLLYVLSLLGIVLLTVWYFKPSEFKSISDERYLELYFANRTLEGNGERSELSRDYLNFNEDFIPPTIYQKKRLPNLPQDTLKTKEDSKLNYKKEKLSYKIDINTPRPNVLYVYNTYFPGWKAKMDGNDLDVYPSTDYGLLTMNIPKGEHNIVLEFGNTTIRNVANGISLFTMIVLVTLSFVKFKGRGVK